MKQKQKSQSKSRSVSSSNCKKFVCCRTAPHRRYPVNTTRRYPPPKYAKSAVKAIDDSKDSNLFANMILLSIVIVLAIYCLCNWSGIANALGISDTAEALKQSQTELTADDAAENYDYDSNDYDYYEEETECSCHCGCPYCCK